MLKTPVSGVPGRGASSNGRSKIGDGRSGHRSALSDLPSRIVGRKEELADHRCEKSIDGKIIPLEDVPKDAGGRDPVRRPPVR
jgi:hypothetical protein